MRLIPLALLGLFAVAAAAPVASAASPRERAAAGKVVKPATRAGVAAAAPRGTARAPQLVSRAAAAPVLRSGPTVRGRTAMTVSAGPRARQTAKAAGRSIRQQPQVARGSIRGGAYEEVAEAPARFTGRGARYTSWQSGLPAASGEQRDCPAGTMSTLARGHDDVVRCMPL